MTVPHNIIKLQLPDGREVSIIQNGNGREGDAYGHAEFFTCEVLVEGEHDVEAHMTLRDLFQYLAKLSKCDADEMCHLPELSNDWTLAKEFQDD